MRGSLARVRQLYAALTALLLLASVTPDAWVVWSAGEHHAHDHGAAHGAGGEWVERTADHAPHDASQLEASTPVLHSECGLCAARVRPLDSLLGLVTAVSRQDSRATLARDARSVIAAGERNAGQPRAPPIV